MAKSGKSTKALKAKKAVKVAKAAKAEKAEKAGKSGKAVEPTPQRASLLEPWFDLRGEMDRMFEDFFGRSFPMFPRLRAAMPETVVPDVDVTENDKAITIAAELPGLDEKDVELTLRDGVLILKGEKSFEREEEEENVYVSERRYGSFQRSFRLPPSVDEDKISADFDKGVLTITLPKSQAAQTGPTRVPLAKK